MMHLTTVKLFSAVPLVGNSINTQRGWLIHLFVELLILNYAYWQTRCLYEFVSIGKYWFRIQDRWSS